MKHTQYIQGITTWGNMKANQRLLNSRIQKQHKITQNDFYNVLRMSLSAEMMEYANATRCFKVWSTKDPDSISERLEEFVDGIHFYLSYFIILEITNEEIINRLNNPHDIDLIKTKDKKEIIKHHLEAAMSFLYKDHQNHEDHKENILLSFAHFMTAGGADGFHLADIERAYYIKCQKNHERQDQGY